MSTVLAAVDDSAAAGPVIASAAALAPLLGSSVTAVHVGEGSGRTAADCAARAGVPFRTVPGDPVEVLARLAAQDVTAVVVGARDEIVGQDVGHLAVELADASPVPVLVVPPDCVPAADVRRVLIALESEPGRAKPLRRAVDVVAGSHLDITVVHVSGPEAVPSFSDSRAHEMTAFAQEYLARAWPAAPPVHLALPVGAPAEQVLAVADEARPDVLVAGWPAGAGPDHGHVVRRLLRHSRCPVLLVQVDPPTGP